MKECFTPKEFNDEASKMIEIINCILDDYEQQGYDLSLRQLYYQLVAKDLIENTENSYKRIGSLVSDARLAGLIDWDMIKDRGRPTITNNHWQTPKEILEAAAASFKIDHWEDQPSYVEVFVEKQALEGILIPVCRELDIPFTANKGYSSSSAMYEASKRYAVAADRGKTLHLLYLGDHDPSGIDMTRDVEDRLQLFVDEVLAANAIEPVEVQRLALNMDQIQRLKPPKNPAKLTDTRSSAYIKRFGTSSWELDAVEPATLADLVRRAVQSLIDDDRWDESQKRQTDYRKQLLKYAGQYK